MLTENIVPGLLVPTIGAQDFDEHLPFGISIGVIHRDIDWHVHDLF